MSVLDDLEKTAKKIGKGVVRRGKKAASEVEKTGEKVMKSAKGLASQTASKLKAGVMGGTINKNARKQMSTLDTSGVNVKSSGSSTPDRWK